MALSIAGGATLKGVRMSKAPAGFDPVTFWAGQTGGFWDFTNPANLFSDVALTVPATLNAAGGVWGVADLSGLGTKLTQQNNGVTFTSFTMRSGYCESFLGGLATASVPSMTAYTAIILVRPSTVITTQALMDTDYGSSNRISQNIIFMSVSVMESYIFGYGTPTVIMPSPTLVASTDYYASVATDSSSADLRVGGTTYNSGAGGTPGGATVPIAVGAAYAGTNTYPNINPFSGRIYCAAWINKKCTPTEIQDIGNYMNSLAGTSATV
jgi:hypothetical protein